MNRSDRTALVSLRTALILLLGVVAGLLMGALAVAGGASVALGALVGLPAAASTVVALHGLVERG